MPVKPAATPENVARRYVSSEVMRTEPRNGPSAVPMPPMMLLSAKRTERSMENTCDGSTKPTYCAHRLPPVDVSAVRRLRGPVARVLHRPLGALRAQQHHRRH